jgi:excinuclease ABC subunit C
VLNEKLERPGLIMVDGGKGQVNAVRGILDSLSMTDIPVVGLAKDVEEIVFDDDRPPLLLDESDEGLRVLIAIRDECHRFATSANQKMRSSDATFKILESIDGIGEKRSHFLMQKFGSLDAMMRLDAKALAREGEIPLPVAERILRTLKL